MSTTASPLRRPVHRLRGNRRLWTVLLAAGAVALSGTAVAAPAAGPPAGPPAVRSVDLRIPASMPDDHGKPVTLDAQVLLPERGCPCPGVIWNHGYGGSKNGDGDRRRQLASSGYVILSYTSRGFGATPGQVDLMGAKEQQDLLDAVDWLNNPANPVTNGAVRPNTIGQVGASYGGFHAWFLARSGHPAVRTTVPIATATDLYEAIVPNDVLMLTWANGFYASGYRPQDDNYSQAFHRAVAEMNTGVNTADARQMMQARAVKGRWANVRVPVFIIQGVNDGLFPANQAMEAYRELTARGVAARLYLGGIGHPPALSSGKEVDRVFEQVKQWLDLQLKGDHSVPLATAPPIEVADAGYFNSTWDGTVRTADEIGTDGPTLRLCATSPRGGTLSTSPCPAAVPVALANTVAGSGYADEPVTGGYLRKQGVPVADTSALPSVVTFDSAPTTREQALDLAGIPAFDLQVTSLAQLPVGARGALAAFQLDPKLWDVAPDGTATLVTRGAFSEQLDADALSGQPVHRVRFDAFAAFYRLPAGHRLRLTLATEDGPYLRPTVNPFVVVLQPGSTVQLPDGGWLNGSGSNRSGGARGGGPAS